MSTPARRHLASSPFKADPEPTIENFEMDDLVCHDAHGVGTPDLGLAAWRSATILNHLTGGPAYPQPRRTAFTTFGLAGRETHDDFPAPHDLIPLVEPA